MKSLQYKNLSTMRMDEHFFFLSLQEKPQVSSTVSWGYKNLSSPMSVLCEKPFAWFGSDKSFQLLFLESPTNISSLDLNNLSTFL